MPLSSPAPRPTETVYTFAINLYFYEVTKPPRAKLPWWQGGEEDKNKELKISLNDNNYLAFLHSLLEKHGQDQYKFFSLHLLMLHFILPSHSHVMGP